MAPTENFFQRGFDGAASSGIESQAFPLVAVAQGNTA
jgi:hypothetical protein